MPENLSNKGYIAIGKETTPGVAVTPSIFIPLYDDSMKTNTNVDKDSPIVGLGDKYYQAIQGLRDHGGDFSVIAEPNSAAHILNMLYTWISTTSLGGGLYRHKFMKSFTADPKSYTVDIAKGRSVWRFPGTQASQLDHSFDKDKMIFKVKASSLLSMIVRNILSLATATVTLDTAYDPNPTNGLVVGDLVTVENGTTGATQSLTILSLTATTVTFTTTPSAITSGDKLYLRPQTATFNTLAPFLWATSNWQFGTTASAALAASQTRIEQGAKYTLIHEFNNDKGEPRSGGFDPASLVRKLATQNVDFKRYFDTLNDMNNFLTCTKFAAAVIHKSGGGQYIMQNTFNHLVFSDDPAPMKSDAILYSEGKADNYYDSGDGQAYDCQITNTLSAI